VESRIWNIRSHSQNPAIAQANLNTMLVRPGAASAQLLFGANLDGDKHCWRRRQQPFASKFGPPLIDLLSPNLVSAGNIRQTGANNPSLCHYLAFLVCRPTSPSLNPGQYLHRAPPTDVVTDVTNDVANDIR
jgi:hypothetical protein